MSETLPLSALQHYLYCPRQCALIHVEKVWMENRFTAEGRIMHRRADSGKKGRRDGVPVDRAVPLRSDSLGLYGIADVVEIRRNVEGARVPYPVEYKRGSPKIADWDRAQLCAQAICLEEMLGVDIPDGAIFYGKPRRREQVIFSEELRHVVEEACLSMHSMIAEARTPPPEPGQQCRGCSLRDCCMPKNSQKSVGIYLLKGLES